MPDSQDWASQLGQLLDPRPLANTLWQNRGLLNPMPLAHELGRLPGQYMDFVHMLGDAPAEFARRMDVEQGTVGPDTPDPSPYWSKDPPTKIATETPQEDPRMRLYKQQMAKTQAGMDPADKRLAVAERAAQNLNRGAELDTQALAKMGAGFDQPGHASRAKPDIPYPMLRPGSPPPQGVAHPAPIPPGQAYDPSFYYGPSMMPPGVRPQQGSYTGNNPLTAWMQMVMGR